MENKKISQILIGYCCVLSILASCAKIEEIDNNVVIDNTIENNTKIGDDNYSDKILMQTSIPILDSRTGAPAGYVLETMQDGALSQRINLNVEMTEEYTLEELYDESNQFIGYLMNVKTNGYTKTK